MRAVDSYKKNPCGVERVGFAKFQLTTNGQTFAGDACERRMEACLLSALYGRSRFTYASCAHAHPGSNGVEIAAWINIDERPRFSPRGNKVEFECRAVTVLRGAGAEPSMISDRQYVIDREESFVSENPGGARESMAAELVRKMSTAIDEALDARFPLSAPVNWKQDAYTLGIGTGEGAGFRRGDRVVIVRAVGRDDVRMVAIGEVSPESGRGTVRICRWLDASERGAIESLAAFSRIPADSHLVAIRFQS